jgi:general nucleoside transport system ATP-binding protein
VPESEQARAAELRAICKSFYGVAANDNVDFDLEAGEIHALLGENGAGKSTLCSVLAGLYRPDSGEIFVDGRERRFRSPHDALTAGVGMVYQHYRLVERFTVAENLMLGLPTAPARTSRRELERRAEEVTARYGISVPPSAYVEDLSLGEQQKVEILKLLNRGIRVLILDEPTAVLTPQEAEALFVAMRDLVKQGVAIVFVSHKLNEVLEICDRITVLRDGRRVDTLAVEDADHRVLARLMVERNPQAHAPAAARRPATATQVQAANEPQRESVLSVRDLHVAGDRGEPALHAIDLSVGVGEILGVAGVAGNGQRELAEAVAGIRRAAGGKIVLGGRDVTHATVRERTRGGGGVVPGLSTGVAAGRPLEENIVLRTYWRSPFTRRGFLSRRAMLREATAQTKRFDIRGTRRGLPVGILSGGNLQRLILARETAGEPILLVVASPSRGLDISATENVRDVLRRERERGAGILLISDDLEETLELADRIIVLYEGRISGEITPAGANLETIGLLMAGMEAA